LQHVEDAGHRQQHVVLADLGLTAIAAPPVAPAVAEPATPTAATFLLAVGGLLSPLRTLLLLLLLLFVLSAGVSRLLGGGATLLTAAAPGRPPAAAAAPVVLLAAGITGLLAAAAATAGGGRPVVVRLRRGAIALGRGILGLGVGLVKGRLLGTGGLVRAGLGFLRGARARRRAAPLFFLDSRDQVTLAQASRIDPQFPRELAQLGKNHARESTASTRGAVGLSCPSGRLFGFLLASRRGAVGCLAAQQFGVAHECPS